MILCSKVPDHMTKMAAMPIYGKDFNKSSSMADDLGTWYAASSARIIPSLLKDDPELTLTYFTARSNLVPYAFVLEKR